MAENNGGQNKTEPEKTAEKTTEKLRGNGETVCVGCKIPQGIVLRLFNMTDAFEPVMGGGSREVKKAEEMGRIVLKGWNDAPDPENPVVQSRKGTYGITRRVPKEAFEAWWRANEKSSLVANKLIIAAPSEDRLRSMIKEMDRELKHGEVLAPIDPSMHRNSDGLMIAKDPRFPRGTHGQALIQRGERENSSMVP